MREMIAAAAAAAHKNSAFEGEFSSFERFSVNGSGHIVTRPRQGDMFLPI